MASNVPCLPCLRGGMKPTLIFEFTEGLPISPFHDIPLYADKEKGLVNMVVEVPRFTNLKLEIATEEPLNPIKLRSVKKLNVYACCNYGALPQTWQDPNHTDESTGANGDNDPVDVFELGSQVHRTGEIIQVKLLGCICIIDNGEIDWKLLAIDANDSEADQMNDIDDLRKCKPGLLTATLEMLKTYKPQQFLSDYETRNRDTAMKVVKQSHRSWKELLSKPKNELGLDLTNVSVSFSPHKVTKSDQILRAALESDTGRIGDFNCF